MAVYIDFVTLFSLVCFLLKDRDAFPAESVSALLQPCSYELVWFMS